MLALAKFLHLFGLMLGAGAGFGQLVLARQIRASGSQPKPELQALRPVFARLALAGIILLWLTGPWLYFGFYAGAPLGAAFHTKLAVATLLLVVVAAINIVISRARAANTPPPAWFPRLGMTAGPLLLIVVALAVYVFN